MRILLLIAACLVAAPQEDFDRRLDEFAGRIEAGTDATLVRFQKAARARAGKIVVRDRAEKLAEGLRREGERDALPEYFRARFEEIEGEYRLRAGQEEFRRRMLEDAKACQADLARLRPAIKEVADNMVDAPEINARVKKTLSSAILMDSMYFSGLREKTRPDIYALLRKLGEVLTQAEDGKYFIPEARQESAKGFSRLGAGIMDLSKSTSGWLKTFCDGVASPDDLHKRLKAASSDPLFTAVLFKDALSKADPNDIEGSVQRVKDAADEIVAKIPEAFTPTPQGKVLIEKGYDSVEKILDTYDRARSKVSALRPAAADLAGRLREGDDLHATFRRMLQSDVIIAIMDIDAGGAESDPVKILNAQVQKVLQKRDDGKYEVRPESADEVAGEIKDPVRATAKEERAVKLVSMFGEKIGDPELRAIFTSAHGRFEVERTMKAALAVRTYDGLGAWIARHFEKSAGGFRLHPASRSEIETIVAEAERLDKEGGKNDLKD